MHLTTRGRYAVMAMIDLAELQRAKGGRVPITLAEIAERQDISLSYLEQLFARLRRAGVVKSVRGPGGGYILARPVEKICLGDVIRAVDEQVSITRCGHAQQKNQAEAGCLRGRRCNAHQLWAALSQHIEGFMERVHLGMVLNDEVTPDFS